MSTETFSWKDNYKIVVTLEAIMRKHAVTDLASWKGPDSRKQDVSFTLLEKVRVNLLACEQLLLFTIKQPIQVVPLGIVLRTVLIDITNYRFLNTIEKIAGEDGYYQELNIIGIEYVKSIRKIYSAFGRTSEASKDILEAAYQEKFAPYLLPTGKIKSSADFRKDRKDLMTKIDKYKKTIGIADTPLETESGKIAFLDYPYKNDMAILYSFYGLYHHFSVHSAYFYKDAEARVKAIEYCYVTLFLAADMIHDILSELTPGTAMLEKLNKVLNEMTEKLHKSNV